MCLCSEEVGSVCSCGLGGGCLSLPLCLGDERGATRFTPCRLIKETRKWHPRSSGDGGGGGEGGVGAVLIAAVCLPMQIWNVCFPQCSAVTERRVRLEWAGVQL